MTNNLFSEDSENNQKNHQDMVRSLTDLRNEVAKKTGQERFKILQNKTIDFIAESRPQTLKELSGIKGIGPKKLKELGSAILAITKGESGEAFKKEKDIQLTEAGEVIFSVREFLEKINELLSPQNVLVEGEISSVNVHPSGVYLTLKDKKEDALLECYIRPHIYDYLGVELQDGMEVKIGGFPAIYQRNGRFRFMVQSLEIAGEGSLKKAYELLKAKLEKEGLFTRKRELPEFIKRIGVITSRQGAVIEDFKNNLKEFGFEIFLKDVRVEGVRAVDDICEALSWFNENAEKMNLDVLVVMRGGGSLEDLQAFNNELVAKAIFASRVPTICAIGHHKDVPIASLVGDEAPSTPTGAAVRVNASWDKLTVRLPSLEVSIFNRYEGYIYYADNFVSSSFSKMTSYFERAFTKFESLKLSIINSYENALESALKSIENAGKYLEGVSPERNLKLGYSIVTNNSGRVVRDTSGLKVGERLRTRLYKGEIESEIKKIN